jgi:hypothetical protein
MFITNGSLSSLYYFSFASRSVIRVAAPLPPSDLPPLPSPIAGNQSSLIQYVS